jgi:hypothetical protein
VSRFAGRPRSGRSYPALACATVKRLGPAVIALLTVAVVVGLPARTGAATSVESTAAFFEYPPFFFGAANGCYYPSEGAILRLDAPVVALAVTPDDGGDWQAAADGGVLTCGDARFYGSAGNERLNAPVVGMAATHDGKGYWLVAADGGVFGFGDARFHGSAGNLHLKAPVVGIVATPTATATGWLQRTGVSSLSVTPVSTARPATSASTPRWSASLRPPTATATGWWPRTAACSPSETPASTARRPRSASSPPSPE